MKIGILTFNKTLNYGALLQMYALQTKIEEFGYDCKVIDYKCEAVENDEIGFSLKTKKSFKQKLKNILMYKIQNDNLRKFNMFNDKYINVTLNRFDKNTISDSENDFDRFIVGSDQVWNLELTNGDFTYFLNFLNDSDKKRSYAASLGYSKIPDKYLEENKKYLQQFCKINVREEEGKKILSSILQDKDIDVTIDPTLLLEKFKWNKILTKNSKLKNEKYILVYLPCKSKETFKLIKKFAKEKKCKIKFIHRSIYSKFGMENIKSASPNEFLDLIYNAEYVITGSFHAMCFSIIFNKQFFYTIPPIANRGSRLINLADMFELKNREFNNKNIINNKNIDYKKVNKILKEKREESAEILRKTLEI